jgi:hypothetical protein
MPTHFDARSIASECYARTPDVSCVAKKWFDEGDPRVTDALTELMVECVGGRGSASSDIALAIDSLGIFDLLVAEQRPTWTAVLRAAAARPVGAMQDQLLEAADEQGLRVDIDHDGLSVGAERRAGSDPWRWDTDGDGWWDGYDGPQRRRLALELDVQPVCVGVARRDREVTVKVTSDFEGTISVFANGEYAGTESAAVPRGAMVSLQALPDDPEAAGGVSLRRVRGLAPCPAAPSVR